MPLASWLGAATTLLITILGFFIKDAYAKVNKRLDEIEKRNIDLDSKVNTEVRKIEHSAAENKLAVLERLSDIKQSINDARK